jgi:hypothetical protein
LFVNGVKGSAHTNAGGARGAAELFCDRLVRQPVTDSQHDGIGRGFAHQVQECVEAGLELSELVEFFDPIEIVGAVTCRDPEPVPVLGRDPLGSVELVELPSSDGEQPTGRWSAGISVTAPTGERLREGLRREIGDESSITGPLGEVVGYRSGVAEVEHAKGVSLPG